MPLNRNNELIFGLVAPLGVELEQATDAIERVLSACAYKVIRISLSEFLHQDTNVFDGDVPVKRDVYIRNHQAAGNDLRKKMNRNDAVALGALYRIHAQREKLKQSGGLCDRVAFVVRQFKAPDEITLLRKVYGDRFVLIGIHAEKEKRIKWLSKAIDISHGETGVNWTTKASDAKSLIETDEVEEDTPHGQRARDTFPLADFFASWSGAEEEEKILLREKTFHAQFKRFIDALLRNPESVPTTEEFLMFQARAVALRSADWSRQVGAVIATREGSVIAVGRNDDPKVGGGVVASRKHETRAIEFKRQTVREVLVAIKDWLKPELVEERRFKSLAVEAIDEKLKSTRLMGMGEFGRMVHAEMAALTDAAARGVAVGGQIMFCTTFPCQNCAKHLMAAGIRALVHIEPYPKSLVLEMYENETYDKYRMEPLASDEFLKQLDADKSKFLLLNFMGVAPRRYEQLFTMPDRKDGNGNQIKWDPKIAEPRLNSPLESHEYFDWELSESQALDPFLSGSKVGENRVTD
jgi:deoxycytidylate deaminase